MACLRKRGKSYYALYSLGGQQKCVNLHTDSLHIAKVKSDRLNLQLQEAQTSRYQHGPRWAKSLKRTFNTSLLLKLPETFNVTFITSKTPLV